MQNLATVRLTEADLAAVHGALGVLRRVFGRFTALQPEPKRTLTKMGGKSEMFCRQTLDLLASNPQIVPPSIDVLDARNGLPYSMRYARACSNCGSSSSAARTRRWRWAAM